jgi:hypothetical protein
MQKGPTFFDFAAEVFGEHERDLRLADRRGTGKQDGLGV